jgi:hypothetical protein
MWYKPEFHVGFRRKSVFKGLGRIKLLQLIIIEYWSSWLRHYATRWKVAGSIPIAVIGFFNSPNPSSLTMALGVDGIIS